MSCLKCLSVELSQIWDGFEFWIFTYKVTGYMRGSDVKADSLFVDTLHIV